MELCRDYWDKEGFELFRNYLLSLRSEKLADFNSQLTPGEFKFIGLSIPKQDEIAKKIFKGDFKSFLEINPLYHEEKMIKGFVISQIKDFDLLVSYLKDFVFEIDNWAICDCVAQRCKVFKKNLDRGIDFIYQCLNSDKEYIIRFGIVLVLSFYLDRKYIGEIVKNAVEVKFEAYYVKMAVAWLVATAFAKFPEEMMYCFDGRLDKFTHNKAISKICDSFRVSKDQKEEIKKLRIK